MEQVRNNNVRNVAGGQDEPSSPPIRKNVLFLSGGIVLVAGGAMAAIGFTVGLTAASVMGIAGMAIAPLAMMGKELLTPEPGPTVTMPANTFERVVLRDSGSE